MRCANVILILAFLLGLTDTGAAAQKRPAPAKGSAAKEATLALEDEDLEILEGQLALLEEKIGVTKKEIGRIRDATYLPDLYFALADMHVQRSRLMYLIKVQKNPNVSPDTLDFAAEKRPKIEAIEIYQKIYNFFPKEKRRDKALFLTGLEQRDLGQYEQMVRTFQSLSQEFPQSEHFAEANIIVGDFLFEQKKEIDAAIEVFTKVVNRPLSAFTPLAHYRVGWCYINLLKYPEALKSYEDALSSQALVNPAELPETYRKSDIRREAVVALALPYVEIYSDPKTRKPDMLPAVDYFRKKSPDHFTYRRVLSRAGRRLILKENWKESADAFYHVLSLSTDFDTRFEALQRVNESWKKGKAQIDFLGFVREIGITVDLLQASVEKPMLLDGNAVIAIDREREKATKSSKGNVAGIMNRRPLAQLQFLELLMRDFSTQLHRKAKTTGSPADFEQTAEAYEHYLNRFPQAPKNLDIQYNLAEALFRGDKLVRAGMQYEVLSKDKRLVKRASVFKESAVESYTKALAKADTMTPVEKIRSRRGLREVGEEWLKQNPNSPGAGTAAFNIANSWYEERNLKRAIGSFQSFIKRYPKDPMVRDAIFLVINAYSQLDDYKGLGRAGEHLLKTPALAEADKQTIRDAIRRAQTKQLQTLAGSFGTKEYAENLLEVASKYKGSSLGVQALYEAFLSMKSKKDPELFEVGEALLDQHAESQYAKEVASNMAVLALSTASFDRAAKYLTRFAEKYPKEKESPEFRKTSAVLLERKGDYKRARAAYEKLGDRASVARMDLLTNDWARLERSSLASGMREAKYWNALSIWRQNRFQDATPLLRALAVDGSIPADQSGHARFLLAQLSLERFRAIRMKSAEDQQALGEKVKAFQVLSNELQEVIKLGAGRWPIAGLYLLGQTHYDLGRFIADSPLPQGLSEADKKTYIQELNKQAGSYMTEADKVFKSCIDAAQTNDVFTRYVDGCRARGRKMIREDADLNRAPAKTSGSEPPRAKAIRKELIEKSKDVNLLFDLGETYVRADQPQTATGIFSRILELDKENARAIASIGVASIYTNDFDGAYESFKQALKIDSRNATALYNLAGLYKQFGFQTKFAGMKDKMRGVPKPKLLHPWGQ